MRYRRFGRSDLEVSEVGFGVWTLASDWWGRIDDPRGMLHAAVDVGITFIDTAPVYGDNGVGETLLADLLKSDRSEIVLTTKCGYDIDSPRPESQSERRQDWKPASVRAQLEASLRRLGTDYIDLYQLHNARLDPIHDDALWEELDRFRIEGKVRELGVALGPAIGWVEEGLDSVRERPIVSLQTVFNVLEQEPGLTFAAEPNVAEGRVGLISRVPHVSDTLSGKITRDTEFPPGDHRAHRNRENMLDNFDKAETLAFLWGDTGARSDKPLSPASSRIPPLRRCSPHASRSRTCASTRRHPIFLSPTTSSRSSMSVGSTISASRTATRCL